MAKNRIDRITGEGMSHQLHNTDWIVMRFEWDKENSAHIELKFLT